MKSVATRMDLLISDIRFADELRDLQHFYVFNSLKAYLNPNSETTGVIRLMPSLPNFGKIVFPFWEEL